LKEELSSLSTQAQDLLLLMGDLPNAACCQLREGSILVQLDAMDDQHATTVMPTDLEQTLLKARTRNHSHVRFAAPSAQTEIEVAFDCYYRSRDHRTRGGLLNEENTAFALECYSVPASAEDYCELLQNAVANFDVRPSAMLANEPQLAELRTLGLAMTDAKASTPGYWWLCDDIVRLLIGVLDHFIEEIDTGWSKQLGSFERALFGARSALVSSLRAPIGVHLNQRTGDPAEPIPPQ
jgi:hypothetical protein